MALNDIYRLEAFIENPAGASSFGMYYKEVTATDTSAFGTEKLAKGWSNDMQVTLKAILSDDFTLVSVQARRVLGDPVPPFQDTSQAGPGVVVGPGLPSQASLNVRLTQATFTAKHNGRIFIPGIAESVTNVGALSSAHMTGPVNAFQVALAALVEAPSPDLGQWEIGIINRTVLDAAPPAKDWAGAFARATGIGATPIVAIQRRRATRALGLGI